MINRNTKFLFVLLFSLILVSSGPALADNQSTRDIIQRAMKDEMDRNLQQLELENLERPFYISYSIRDVKTMEVIASLGAIVQSDENKYRTRSVRLMVGDYSLNDENFVGSGGMYRQSMLGGSVRLPLEDDYSSIRRALWIATDNTYKTATEIFEHKKVALKQQTLTGEEASLDDFSKTPVAKYTAPPRSFAFKRNKWEKVATQLSSLFRDYPDIYSSRIRIFFYQCDVFFTNSEGTETIQPLTLATLQINAYTQAVDGVPLSDHTLFFDSTPGDLPSLRSMKKAVKSLAEELVALRNAPVFDESYFGPIMFEDQAVAELFAQRLFTGSNGLLAYRKPIVSDSRSSYYRTQGETLDDRINRRIMSRDLTIKALPGKESFSGQKLLGSCHVDAEGVKPPPEIVLVDNGILKTLLNNRIPKVKVRESNGHQRPVIGLGTKLGPSVISVTTSKGKSNAEMKNELLQLAREEGMDYAILVRKLKPPVGSVRRFESMVMTTGGYGSGDGSSLTQPILVYRVYVEDGREELVRSVNLGSLGLSSLRRMLSASQKRLVYNMPVSGVPSSFIVPQSLIIEELDVKKEQQDYTPKLPVVSSPLHFTTETLRH